LVRKAHEFAAKAHAGVVRIGTGEPYVEHTERVAAMVAELGFPDTVVAAAYLHDVLEDTDTTFGDLVTEFGPEVAALVAEVTNPKIPKLPGNRDMRKAADREHLSHTSYAGASLKLADMVDNSSNVADVSPKFAKRYLPEMLKKLDVLGHGHPALLAKVSENIANGLLKLGKTEKD
jgi:(p)ppGpp synthase/HD superfamily hydrolase